MKRLVVVSLAILIALSLTAGVAFAAAPIGEVVLTTTYPAVVADKGKTLTFPIEIVNRAQEWQEITLTIEGSPDWQPSLKDRGFTIRRVMVAPGKSQTIDFQARPPDTAKAQDYAFVVRAQTTDGRSLSDLKLVVTLADRVSNGLKLSTQYPELRGQAGTTFTYRFDLVNDASQDRDINLSANAPKGWDVIFKPAYESKQVTTLRVKAGATQGVDVEISVPQRTEAKDYQVVVQAAADQDRAEVPLTLVLVGTNKLSLTTSSGQLNAKATVDEPTNIAFVVKNTGTAPLKNVTFSSSRPDGWQVTFSSDKIEQLPVGEQVEVTAALTPSSRALAGDYMVTITASGPQTSDNKEIRVTVETPTKWGWFAVAAIALVVGGMGGLFLKLSRR